MHQFHKRIGTDLIIVYKNLIRKNINKILLVVSNQHFLKIHSINVLECLGFNLINTHNIDLWLLVIFFPFFYCSTLLNLSSCRMWSKRCYLNLLRIALWETIQVKYWFLFAMQANWMAPSPPTTLPPHLYWQPLRYPDVSCQRDARLGMRLAKEVAGSERWRYLVSSLKKKPL